jgi:dipeptidyl aminopeptidase/acylaminoacyl peptidase
MKNRFHFILLIYLLSGCATNPATPVTPTLVNIPTVGQTNIPTATRALDTTLTPTLEADYRQQCLRIEQADVDIENVATGTMLLSQYISNSPHILLDLATGTQYELPPEVLGMEVSPNGDMVAYIEQVQSQNSAVANNILWVVDARANVLSKIAFAHGDLFAPRWLDNNRLIIDTSEYGNLLVANPFTGEQRMVSNELPNLYTFPSPGGPFWRVEYSPDLEWVAYYYVEPGGDRGAIVRNVITEQNLWQSMNMDEGKPAWSPDGQTVAVVGDGQLYLVNRFGKVQPVLDDKLIHEAQSPSWSPDGQQIAFWNNNSLVIYNTQTNQVVDLCIPGNGEIILPPVLWSPDGQQIIVVRRVLVDLQRKAAYKIKEFPNATIFGWMNSLP